uniref:Tetratricopeptide repeat protein n=1 Tax=Rheinheimera sp. BAL341 TaxID=1708203 RepID=A0A486XIZ6_9GAMM
MRLSGIYFAFFWFAGALHAAEHLSDHEQFCQQQSAGSCIDYIQQSLALLPSSSSAWYKVKSYELDYYFDTQAFEALITQTSLLLKQDKMPPAFLLQLYFYHAKSLFYFKHNEQARHYANLALEKLGNAFDQFGTPLRLVELANLYYSLNEPQQAFQLLVKAGQQFSKHRDPLFWFELYSNQALIVHLQDDLAGAETLRAKALAAALDIGHNGKLIIGYGNLARTQQLRGNYTAAYQNYLNSLPYFSAGVDDKTLSIYQLRLAEISWQTAQYQQAVGHLKQVASSQLGDYHLNHLKLYQQLQASPELHLLMTSSAGH